MSINGPPTGLPPGRGDYVRWCHELDDKLTAAYLALKEIDEYADEATRSGWFNKHVIAYAEAMKAKP